MKTEIHIWDLPVERVYVKLRDGFREDFFNKAHKKFNNWRLLGEFLGVTRGDTTLAINWKKGMNCCPLGIVFDICKLIDLPKTEVEQNIVEIRCKSKLNCRGGGGGKALINPKLPIKIDNDFVEILGHICGDGTISINNPKKGINLSYINSEYTLIESFQKKIKSVFGEVEPNILVRQGVEYGKKYNKPNYYMTYPTIISLFVLSIFDYKTGDNMDFPNFIFDLPDVMKCKFLRALYDDEGTVVYKKKKQIVISMKPKRTIIKIKKLLKDLRIKTGKINYIGNSHRLGVYSEEGIRKFEEKIGFKHPLKRKKLNIAIERGWKFKRYRNGEVKNKILSLLKKENFVTETDLVNYLQRNINTIRMHINRLSDKGLIVKDGDKPSIIYLNKGGLNE